LQTLQRILKNSIDKIVKKSIDQDKK
jgi:hypothetical protein